MFSSKKWRFIKTSTDGNCLLFGVNIFKYNWISTGEQISVTDPLYGQVHTFNVFTAEIKGESKIFAAGEFSNNVWGFYVYK